MTRGVVLLACAGDATNIVYHALTRAVGEIDVVLEERVPRSQLLRRRVQRLGWTTVAGQVAFVVLLEPVLARRGRRRIAEILAADAFDAGPIEGSVHHVPSVNSDVTREVLGRLDPAVVVVNGTRIIAPATLDAIESPFLNMHAGITPRYRGVHGGYWALVEGRPDLVGTTVHLVDAGIDTGGILAQATFAVATDDSFATYPYLHVAAGMPLLVDAVSKVLAGEPLTTCPPLSDGPSQLRSHPTIWEYAGFWWTARVR